MPTPEDEALTERDYTRLQLRLMEANIVLRALAIGGTPVNVDLVERTDPIFAVTYTEVVTSAPKVSDDPCGTDDCGEDPA